MNLAELAGSLPIVHKATFDQNEVGGKPTYVSDVHAAFVILINRGVNLMGGIAVAHVVSPMALTVITSASTSGFARLGEGTIEHPMKGGYYVGTLNDIPVMVDPTADENVPLRTIAFNANGDLGVSEVGLKNISFI